MTKNKLFHALLHVAVWSILLFVPISLHLESPDVIGIRWTVRNVTVMTMCLIAFYVNYLVAIDKLYYTRRYLLFIIANAILFWALQHFRDWGCVTLENLLAENIRPPHKMSDAAHRLFVFNDIIYFALVVLAALGVRHSALISEVELRNKKLENETLTSELSLLKYQIQPHFFFNSLNNIYALISLSPSSAQKAVHSLSKMMRYILYDSSQPMVMLSKEADFLMNYCTLMKLRLPQMAHIELRMVESSVAETVSIPSLILIPLLENAFKHGVGPQNEANIQAELSLESGRVRFCVSNDTYDTVSEDKSHSGIGLQNLSKRLDILFPDNYTLSAHTDPTTKKYTAEINFPAETKTRS